MNTAGLAQSKTLYDAAHIDHKTATAYERLFADTFVLAQIRPEVALTSSRSRLYHLRSRDARHEIDLIAELSGGDVVAVEIKSSAAPTRGDARHLEWLREQLGERLATGSNYASYGKAARVGLPSRCAACRPSSTSVESDLWN